MSAVELIKSQDKEPNRSNWIFLAFCRQIKIGTRLPVGDLPEIY